MGFLIDGMRAVIDAIYSFTGTIGLPSYALAIIILTVLIKMILYPLTKKQMRSMKMMQELAPKIKEIQAKNKDKDPKLTQQKIMEMYKENNVNPMSGCLPIIVQMPILIALYRALLGYHFVSPEHAYLFTIYLADKDPTYILPILAGLTTYIQTKLTTNTADQTQKTMLYMMPLFIAWISSTVPAGLALYWVVFNVTGAIQQYFINKQVLAPKKEVSDR